MKKILLIEIVIPALCSIGFGQVAANEPVDGKTDDSTGNTYAVLAIEMSASDYNAASSKGGLILVTGILSMLIALGTLFVYGMKGKEAN